MAFKQGIPCSGNLVLVYASGEEDGKGGVEKLWNWILAKWRRGIEHRDLTWELWIAEPT